jgi:hypothetical protein
VTAAKEKWLQRLLAHHPQALAGLVRDDARRADKLNPRGNTSGLPLDDLLSRQDDWLAAVKVYLQAFSDMMPAADM